MRVFKLNGSSNENFNDIAKPPHKSIKTNVYCSVNSSRDYNIENFPCEAPSQWVWTFWWMFQFSRASENGEAAGSMIKCLTVCISCVLSFVSTFFFRVYLYEQCPFVIQITHISTLNSSQFKLSTHLNIWIYWKWWWTSYIERLIIEFTQLKFLKVFSANIWLVDRIVRRIICRKKDIHFG